MAVLARVGPEIEARELFGPERAALVELLDTLTEADWAAPTVCPAWTVHDIAVHLLHDDLRRLSSTRDGYAGRPRPAAGKPLVPFLNRVNEQWVATVRFLSPALLVDLLGHTGRRTAELWARADPHAEGTGVSWAGMDPAPVWLDMAGSTPSAGPISSRSGTRSGGRARPRRGSWTRCSTVRPSPAAHLPRPASGMPSLRRGPSLLEG
jgi:hypothetical protein